MHPSIICSHSSLKVNEPLPGTAPRGDVWMLLEYGGIWGEKAFKESKLPQPVKSHLQNLLEQIPNSKLLLIRQHVARKVTTQGGGLSVSHNRQEIRFYLVLATEQEPLLYAFSLHNYEDLLDLDIPGAVARRGTHSANMSDQVLTLICTNGRRDWCCARYGPNIYQELVQATQGCASPPAIWQSSHLGGHRFAPNVACFPQGIFYGRVEKGEVEIFLQHIRLGQVYATRARGRACYPAPIQAAEIYLHQRLGPSEQGGYYLIDSVENQPGHWVVRFSSLATGQTHPVEIQKEIISDQVFKSCNDPVTAPVAVYRLVG